MHNEVLKTLTFCKSRELNEYGEEGVGDGTDGEGGL